MILKNNNKKWPPPANSAQYKEIIEKQLSQKINK